MPVDIVLGVLKICLAFNSLWKFVCFTCNVLAYEHILVIQARAVQFMIALSKIGLTVVLCWMIHLRPGILQFAQFGSFEITCFPFLNTCNQLMPNERICPVLTLKKINGWGSSVTNRLVFRIVKVLSGRINIYCPPWRLRQSKIFLSYYIAIKIIRFCTACKSMVLLRIVYKRVTRKHSIQVLWDLLVLVVWVV